MHLDPLQHYAAFERAAQERQDKLSAVNQYLTEECLQALLNDPRKPVWTPGDPQKQTPAFDILADQLAGINDDDKLVDLCRVLSDAAKGLNVQTRAFEFLQGVANRHADRHDVWACE